MFSIIVWECKIKTILWYQFKPTTVEFKIKTESNKIWLEPGEIGTLCIAGRNIKWIQLLGKTIWQFLRKLNIDFPYGPPISFPGKD